MRRRRFIGETLTGGALLGSSAAAAQTAARTTASDLTTGGEVVIERAVPGKPHAGKVLAAIQPHADDIPLYAAGTVAKLMNEGYTGYLIRVTNDDMTGPGDFGETVLVNEQEHKALAKAMGFKKVYDLNYNKHRVDGVSPPELRGRFIFLFRLLRVDTVFCYDPWGHYEENPDHYVTAEAVEAACWMAPMSKDYPEHFDAGLKAYGPRERYYYARGPQLVNRIVDISSTMEKKIEVNCLNKAQGPAGNSGARLRARLAAQKLRLPILGDSDETANREYVRHFVLRSNADLGQKYGLQYAEKFHYIGPRRSGLDEYIKQNSVPLR
jgi:LmbE family N-acetylglucosaminyl deacetylase